MGEKVTYYAIIDDEATLENPAGLLRRRSFDDEAAGFRDEGLEKDMKWHHTPIIIEWEYSNYSSELEEVSEEAAQRIIENLRVRWSALS